MKRITAWTHRYRQRISSHFTPHPIPPNHRIPPQYAWFASEDKFNPDLWAYSLYCALEIQILSIRTYFPFLFGETYDDIRKDFLADQLETERRRRELAEMRRKQTDKLSREEQAIIAEQLAVEAATQAGKLLETIQSIDEKRVRAFAKDYMNIVKECLDEFLRAFDEAKRAEIRIFLAEEDAEYSKFLERIRQEGIDVEYGYGIENEREAVKRLLMETDISLDTTTETIDKARENVQLGLSKAVGILDQAAEKSQAIQKAHGTKDSSNVQTFRLLSDMLTGVSSTLQRAQTSLSSIDTKQTSDQFSKLVKRVQKSSQEAQTDGLATWVAKKTKEKRQDLKSSTMTQITPKKDSIRISIQNWYQLVRNAYITSDTNHLQDALRQTTDTSKQKFQKALVNEEGYWIRTKHWVSSYLSPKSYVTDEEIQDEIRQKKEKGYYEPKPSPKKSISYDPLDWMKDASGTMYRASRSILKDKYIKNQPDEVIQSDESKKTDQFIKSDESIKSDASEVSDKDQTKSTFKVDSSTTNGENKTAEIVNQTNEKERSSIPLDSIKTRTEPNETVKAKNNTKKNGNTINEDGKKKQ